METQTMLDRNYLWKDRIYPAEERPGKMDIILKGKRGRLLCTYFMSGGAGRHPVVIICHGFPGNERNMDLAAALRRVGFHVMTFHYSGSWGSDGNFSLGNCLEDLETVFDYVIKEEELHADPDRIFLWGHSMGGFLAYHMAVHRSPGYREKQKITEPVTRPAGVVLAMPADFVAMMQKAGKDPVFREQSLEMMREGADWLVGTSAELLYREAAGMGESNLMERLLDFVADVPMLLINGLEDDMIPSEIALDRMTEKAEALGSTCISRIDLKTDHMAADRRCELTEVTADWLIGQCR